jgi:pyrimidine-nucleoside phosphorylase
MILMSGLTLNAIEAEDMIKESIKSGKAYNKFKELVAKQGGDISYLESTDKFEKAKYIIPVFAEQRGALKSIDTEMIGNISVYLGAGRMKKEDSIDYSAGIIMNQKIGNVVEVGQALAYIYTNDESKIDGAIKNLKNAFILDPKRVQRPKTILGIIK